MAAYIAPQDTFGHSINIEIFLRGAKRDKEYMLFCVHCKLLTMR